MNRIDRFMIKLLILEGNEIIRSSLRQIITDDQEMRVFAEADNVNQMFELLETNDNDIDIILIDIDIMESNSLDVLKRIKNKYSNITVLVLSIHQELQYVTSSLDAGANGYLLKANLADEAVPAIRKLDRNEQYISPYFEDKLNNKKASDFIKFLN